MRAAKAILARREKERSDLITDAPYKLPSAMKDSYIAEHKSAIDFLKATIKLIEKP